MQKLIDLLAPGWPGRTSDEIREELIEGIKNEGRRQRAQEVVKGNTLTLTEVAVMCLFVNFDEDNDQVIIVSKKELAKLWEVDIRHTYRLCAALERKGMIRIVQRENSCNMYRLIF